jgi:hypothetical protein
MPLTANLTQLLTSIFYLVSPTALTVGDLPQKAGDQLVFTPEAQLLVENYQQMPCPIQLDNYLTIYDSPENRCVYVNAESLMKLGYSLQN